jgi:hypothetical protein
LPVSEEFGNEIRSPSRRIVGEEAGHVGLFSEVLGRKILRNRRQATGNRQPAMQIHARTLGITLDALVTVFWPRVDEEPAQLRSTARTGSSGTGTEES